MFILSLQICTFMIDHPDFEVTIATNTIHFLSTFHFISRYIHTFIQTCFHSFMDTFIQALIHTSTNTYLDTCFTYKMVYNSSIVPIYYYCLEFFFHYEGLKRKSRSIFEFVSLSWLIWVPTRLCLIEKQLKKTGKIGKRDVIRDAC